MLYTARQYMVEVRFVLYLWSGCTDYQLQCAFREAVWADGRGRRSGVETCWWCEIQSGVATYSCVSMGKRLSVRRRDDALGDKHRIAMLQIMKR